MKNYLVTLLLASTFTAQLSGATYSGNTSVYTALDICNLDNSWTVYTLTSDATITVFDQTFDVTGTPFCNSGHAKLFYIAHSNGYSDDGTSGHYTFHFNGHGTTLTYKVYGPFSDETTAKDQVADGTAPVASVTFYGGSAPNNYQVLAPQSETQVFIVEITMNACSGTFSLGRTTKFGVCEQKPLVPCQDCLPSFHPADKEFIISGWAREANPPNNTTSYTHSKVRINAGSGPIDFYPSGQIIDGWQRIEGRFTAGSAGSITVILYSLGTTDSYFDDIRIFPNDGSVMSYVYDPISMRLVAELDERNYAKFYEYDEEGKLTRVKKETEQGIMTIQESRENSSLKPTEP